MTRSPISIIIPCYNAEQYVGDAIRSALGQTYPNVEVIVVDDGSSDGSLDVIRSFGDAIRWETGPNRGGCAARNRGLELARGELVQFLDADDLLHPTKLERQGAELQRSCADLIFCDGQSTGEDGQVRRHGRAFRGDAVRYVLAGPLPNLAPLHYRKNLLTIGGFRPELSCAQERDLHLRLACVGLRFHRLPEVLYTVRRVAGSVSSDSLKVLDQHEAIVRRAYDVLAERGELTDDRAQALAGLLAKDARAYLRVGAPERARAYIAAARELHPSGGVRWAYGPVTRLLRRVIGPVLTERCVGLRRRFA